MYPPLPRLADYEISPRYGFLPDELPLQALPHEAYNRWERIMNNFQSLLLSKRLRVVIDKLPVLPVAMLRTEAEWRRAYVVLTFMAHGYIWGGEKPAERLPPSITYPLLQVSEHLELPPVATYAGLCLWNFKPIFTADDLMLENLSTLLTFTGSLDEQWFYLISVALEAKGGPMVPMMLKAIEAARENDVRTVTQSLRTLAQTIDEMGSLLVRMYESCDPHVFYHRIRPYLAGSKNMKDAGLPNGVFYDNGNPATSTFRQYGGGSNAQSSLIQFLDIILGVEHRPTGSLKDEASESESDTGAAPKPRHNFIHEMRSYMPGPHRRFLEAIESVTNIREFVEFNRRDRDLTLAYDACLAMLRALRDKHIAMVSRYIIIKSRESRSISRSRRAPGDDDQDTRTISPDATLRAPIQRSQGIASIRYNDSASKNGKPKKMRGTGGTALIPFLKQARDETGEPAIDDWARKILMGARKTEADREIAIQNRKHMQFVKAESLDGLGGFGYDEIDDEPQIVGLAGFWTMEESGGGLCAF